ncbi:MAG: UPF0175 family protein [bacterium]
MREAASLKKVEVELPEDAFLILQSIKVPKMEFNQKVRLSIALDLFTAGAVSMAKGAEIAGMHRYDFMSLLNNRGISVYEHTEREYEEDQEAIAKYKELKR